MKSDAAFNGTPAIRGAGLAETSLEATTIEAARRIVVLADASKFDLAAFCKICELSAVHELTGDDRADPAEIARARDLGFATKVVPSTGRTTQAVA